MLASLLFGFIGYRSLVNADVLPWYALPALLHGVVAEICVVAGLATLLWSTRRITRMIAGVLVAGLTIVQATQLLSLHFSAGFLSVQALAHVGLASSLVTPRAVGIAVMLPTLALGMVGGAIWGCQVRSLGWTSRLAAAAALLTLGVWLMNPARIDAGVERCSSVESATLREKLRVRFGMVSGTPLGALMETLREAGSRDVIVAVAPTAEQLRTAEAYGLHVDPSAALPLAHPQITAAPLSVARRKSSPKRPNVIVIFAESLSSHLLESYGGQHPGLTPQLTAMARDALQVDDWFNHVTPTVTGLRGQLCSLWPRLSYTPWDNAKTKLRTAKVFCLPHLLAEHGWQTKYWSHGRAHDTYIKAQAIDWGFQDLLFHAALSERWLQEKPKSRQHGVSDQQMMRALGAFVSTPRKPADPPFFLALSTIETHVGFDLDTDGHRYKRGARKSTILDTFHNFDDAFGRFWRAFQASPRVRDTIVIVTADHALYPSDEHRTIAGPAYLNHKFGRTVLLIYDPTHELPERLDANATSVDLAPSLAHLLGIRDRETPWLGRSIFGDRQRTRGALGFIYGKHLLTIDDAGPHIDDQPEADATSLRAVLNYTQALEAQGRVWH